MNKVLLISLDALSIQDYQKIIKLDSFKTLINNGSHSSELISVFPTQTYTVHATIASGVYPDKHKVYNNAYFQPFVKADEKDWHWYRHNNKADTIYDAVKRNGGKVCSLMWPVTAKADIAYNMPEIKAKKGENQVLTVLKNGSLLYSILTELKFGKYRKSTSRRDLDEYLTLLTKNIMKTKAPELIMIHLVSLDSAKHETGIHSEYVSETLQLLDKHIGELMQTNDEYTIIVLGDHGHFDVHKEIFPNTLLRNKGLLNPETKEYSAYIEAMGGSGILHYKDEKSKQKAIEVLKANSQKLSLAGIYDRSVLDSWHYPDEFNIAIEGNPGMHIMEEITDTITKSIDDNSQEGSTHGYNPFIENYSCLFFAMGKNIKENNKLGKIDMVDIAPTVAKILGIDFNNCDGKIIEEIFE